MLKLCLVNSGFTETHFINRKMQTNEDLIIRNPEARPKIIIAILMAYGFCMSLFLVLGFFVFLLFK